MKKKAAKSNQVGKAKGGCAYKKGGSVKKSKKEMKPDGMPSAKRLDKFARGGAAKKNHKTQVNVIIGADKKQPVPVPVPMGGPPAGAPPMMPPRPPGMKTGGKVPHMTAGALSGKGRLQKTEIQKNQK